jgi:hypothetical protein
MKCQSKKIAIFFLKKLYNFYKSFQRLSKICQKVVKKLSKIVQKKCPKSCQKVVKKVVKKLPKNCQKFIKKLSKSCQKSCQKNSKNENLVKKTKIRKWVGGGGEGDLKLLDQV